MEKTLGSFVRARRQELGLNQTELGTLVGMKQTIISRIETGETKRLKKEQVRALASALECTTQEIEVLLKPHIAVQPRTEFGRLFRERREAMGLSIPQLAEIAGVNQAVIRQLELKKSSRIHVATVMKFGTILGVDFRRFVGHRSTRKLTEVGKIIEAKRSEAVLSAEQLAEKIGVSRQYLNEIELGKCPPSDKVVQSLKRELNLNIVRPPKKKPGPRINQGATVASHVSGKTLRKLETA